MARVPHENGHSTARSKPIKAQPQAAPRSCSLLTVLVEDYFHVGAFENLIHRQNWQNFEPRYERNTLKTLDLLDRYGAKATFFVLGWIAELNPGLIKEIVSRGHEVASRGYYHRSPRNLTPDEFREDIVRTNNVIEEASGQRVVGYRAAGKLSSETSEWILKILATEGFAYDASFLPNATTPAAKRVAHEVTLNDQPLWEIPYSTFDLGFGLVPISGGNYFRQLPYTLVRQAVKYWHRTTTDPFVFYFHVWELDPEQPRISAASKYNRIRHYRKLDKMEWILHENLALYRCNGIADYLGIADQLHHPRATENTEAPIDLAATPELPLTPVSIVVPCYNEQETLPYLANTMASVRSQLQAIGYDPHLIFVDDKSEDNTLAVINKYFARDENVKVLQHEVNKGVAAGIVTGIGAAETEIVCSIDCDCTFDPHELVRMIPLLGKDVDMVTASPYHKDGGVRNVPGWRLLLSKGASTLYRCVLNTKIASYTACFRVYRRSAMIDLDPSAPGFHGVAEMLGLLDLKGGKIVEFPTVLAVRLFGISKMKTVKTIIGHIKLLGRLSTMRLAGSYKPLAAAAKVPVLPASTEESAK